MLKAVRRDMMFSFIHESWNPVTGCLHDCYNGRCWAKIMCERFRKVWGHGFEPKFHENRVRRKFPKGSIIFVCSLGDLFGEWVDGENIRKVLDVIRANPDSTFFLQTKNPSRYLQFADVMPRNVILSATVETNRDLGFSKAPLQSERLRAMMDKKLETFRKHISIEPVMDFDIDEFVEKIKLVRPEAVSIGYDNYGAGLPEPTYEKIHMLVMKLVDFTEVHIKTPKHRKRVRTTGK